MLQNSAYRVSAPIVSASRAAPVTCGARPPIEPDLRFNHVAEDVDAVGWRIDQLHGFHHGSRGDETSVHLVVGVVGHRVMAHVDVVAVGILDGAAVDGQRVGGDADAVVVAIRGLNHILESEWEMAWLIMAGVIVRNLRVPGVGRLSSARAGAAR